MKQFLTCLLLLSSITNIAQTGPKYVQEHYNKIDTTIAMRDGIKLYTVIFVPKDSTEQYPFLMERTPYSAAPYGAKNYPDAVGPNNSLMK